MKIEMTPIGHVESGCASPPRHWPVSDVEGRLVIAPEYAPGLADIVPGEHQFVVNAPASGYVIEMNNKSLISLARIAGAPHDRGAGILLHAKKGKLVKAGEPLFTLYADRSWRLQQAIEEGRRLMPVLVEGMLLDRVPSTVEL